MSTTIKYTSAADTSLGLTGMALTIVALDGENYFSEVSLERGPGMGFGFSHDFYFRPNPRLSAKINWTELLRQLRLSSSLTLGNVMCRSYVGNRRRLDRETVEQLRQLIRDLADEECQLEADEADNLFESSYSYLDRLFSSPRVHEVARAFSSELTRRRTMTAPDALDLLRQLGAF